MREIKFRGKTPNGAWAYGSFWNHPVYPDIIEDYSTHRLVDRDTVGQFTGVKDSNGKEIYEGDILEFVHFLSWDDVDEKSYGVVEFKYYSFEVVPSDTSVMSLFDLDCTRKQFPFTVIGNIHDNPELLEVKEDA